jgi:hypothetical protein
MNDLSYLRTPYAREKMIESYRVEEKEREREENHVCRESKDNLGKGTPEVREGEPDHKTVVG